MNGAVAAGLPDVALEDVDVVLTDVVMPEMNGPQMVEALRKRGFSPATIYMSGYTHGVDLGTSLDLRSARFLPKPWSPRTLAMEVRRALDPG